MRKYVYFMQRNSDGFIKIGESDNPRKRKSKVQAEVGEPVELLYYFPQPVPLETLLHDKYRNGRADGEWFNPSEELLEYIQLGISLNAGIPLTDRIEAEGTISEPLGCFYGIAIFFLFVVIGVAISYTNYCVDLNGSCSILQFFFAD